MIESSINFKESESFGNNQNLPNKGASKDNSLHLALKICIDIFSWSLSHPSRSLFSFFLSSKHNLLLRSHNVCLQTGVQCNYFLSRVGSIKKKKKRKLTSGWTDGAYRFTGFPSRSHRNWKSKLHDLHCMSAGVKLLDKHQDMKLVGFVKMWSSCLKCWLLKHKTSNLLISQL